MIQSGAGVGDCRNVYSNPYTLANDTWNIRKLEIWLNCSEITLLCLPQNEPCHGCHARLKSHNCALQWLGVITNPANALICQGQQSCRNSYIMLHLDLNTLQKCVICRWSKMLELYRHPFRTRWGTSSCSYPFRKCLVRADSVGPEFFWFPRDACLISQNIHGVFHVVSPRP